MGDYRSKKRGGCIVKELICGIDEAGREEEYMDYIIPFRLEDQSSAHL